MFCEVCGRETKTLAIPPRSIAPTRTCDWCRKHRRSEVIGDTKTYPCEHCGAIAGGLCWKCGARGGASTRGDDGVPRCASCHVEHLKDRGAGVAGEKIAASIATFRSLTSAIEARAMRGYFGAVGRGPEGTDDRAWRLGPSLLERQGLHPPRPGVIMPQQGDAGAGAADAGAGTRAE